MIKRLRDRAHAPMNSGSKKRPERINLRSSTEECGRFLHNVSVGRKILLRRNPDAPADIADVTHRVIVPVFEKVVRAYRYGSAAEKAAAAVYLEEFVRVEDYIRNRLDRYQRKLSI